MAAVGVEAKPQKAVESRVSVGASGWTAASMGGRWWLQLVRSPTLLWRNHE